MVRAFLTKFSPKSERRLLALCVNNPDNEQDLNEWNKNAVRYLARELRKDIRLIDELERAISLKSARTKCVTVPKTLDRRLLVSHRRGLPQVIYGRLWRWPDLQSHHQIKAIRTCESSAEFSSGVEQPGHSTRVCINPYHYERYNPKPIDPVLVPNCRIPPDLSTSFEDSDTTGETRGGPANLSFLQHLAPYLQQPRQQQRQQKPTQDKSMGEEFKPVLSPQQQQQQQRPQQQQQQQQPQPQPQQQLYQEQPQQYRSPSARVQQRSPQYQGAVAIQPPSSPPPPPQPPPLPSSSQQQDQPMGEEFESVISPQQQLQEQFYQGQPSQYQSPAQVQQPHSPHYQAPTAASQPQQDQPMSEEFEPTLSPRQQQSLPEQFYQGQPPQYQSPGLSVQQQHSPQYQATASTQQQQHPQFLHSQTQAQYQMSPQNPDYPRSQELFSQTPEQRHYQQTQPAQEQFPSQGDQNAAEYPAQFQPGPPQGTGGSVRVLQQRQQQQQQRQGPHLGSEIARPFRFKQNRFSHMARARHGHGVVSRYPPQTSQSYISGTYSAFGPQPASHVQAAYQQHFRPQQQGGQSACGSPAQQQPYPSSYPAPTVSSAQQAQQTRYAQTSSAAATYSTIYSPQQQTQYPNQEQSMQISGYQPDALMTVATQQPGGTYYPPAIAGTSQTFVNPEQLMDQGTGIDIQEVPYTEGAYWCSISYHEYDQRIGEKYHSNCRIVSVDGYTQPMCNDRFCIGGISNVNRDHFTEWVRRRIGRGVKVTYVDGEVYVEGLSEASVFVSNPLLVEEDGDHHIEHVSKLTLGCSAKVFSTQQFSKLLTEAVAKGFEAVYKLTNCCVIRVSFVKGWGRNYKRQSIFRTPCWVEVQLNGPLQWIDKVLRQMRPPTGCGSTS